MRLLPLLLVLPATAFAGDVKIGKKLETNGMEVQAVYIQPVKMEPEHGTPAEKADIHLEADIHALAKNPHGFEKDAWIPYLSIAYRIEQVGQIWNTEGELMPMAASDGPHYGDNVKLNGPGKYKLSLTIQPPSANGFMRHTDKETGVAEWYKPITLNEEFAWIGSRGKKGGY